MRLALGCDDAAFGLAQVIRRHLETNAPVAVSVMDFGAFDAEPVDYPDVAEAVALAVREGSADRGVLLCGTGIGVAIAANKVPGVRAACCHDTYSAERSRASNDAQILTMGARVVGPELALRILDTWLQTEFGGGPSARKVAKITAIERRFMVDPAPRPLQGEDPAP
jgi:ribose 5-phosphate isomerase B